MWHDVNEVHELPSNMDFQVGYFEGKSHAKWWLIENRDLDKINSLYVCDWLNYKFMA